MERYSIDERAAFGMLRDQSRSTGEKVVTISQAMLHSHPLLRDCGPPGTSRPRYYRRRGKIAYDPIAVAIRRPSSWRTSLRIVAALRLRRSTSTVQITSPSVAVCM